MVTGSPNLPYQDPRLDNRRERLYLQRYRLFLRLHLLPALLLNLSTHGWLVGSFDGGPRDSLLHLFPFSGGLTMVVYGLPCPAIKAR